MRILFVTQIIPYPPHGGVLQRGFNLLRELGRNHEVDLLAFHHPDELPPGEQLDQSLKALRVFCRSVEYFPLWPKRSRVHKLAALVGAALHRDPFSVIAHRSAKLRARIEHLCTVNPPDVVHLDTIALAPYARHCGSVPVVLGHHNIESQLMARRAPYERSSAGRAYVNAQARRLERYERLHAGSFPLNVTVSAADATTLQSICPSAKVAVVPNGVDTNYFVPRRGQEGQAIVFTGGMNMFANRDAVEWFIDHVWPLIKRDLPNVRFYVIGQRPSKRILDATAADASIEAPGFVEDVRPWVARAGVYVVPLRVGGGTRLKMVDAMAQGKAIVTTTLGAEGIDGENGTHFVLADEPDAFASATSRLLRDRQAADQLGSAARARAEERYAWPVLGRELASHYHRIIEHADQ